MNNRAGISVTDLSPHCNTHNSQPVMLDFKQVYIYIYIYIYICVVLGGLEVMCSPRDPRFVGSNPAKVDGFFQDAKILRTSPPGGTLSWGSPSLRFQAL